MARVRGCDGFRRNEAYVDSLVWVRWLLYGFIIDQSGIVATDIALAGLASGLDLEE